VAEPIVTPATYADVLAAPEHMVAEVVAGTLHLSPRPSCSQRAASSALGAELFFPFQRGRGGPGGWLIVDGPELHLGEDVVVPDLAGWRQQRLPQLPNAPFITVAPDWICEILSPRTVRLDRFEKRSVYAREGVAQLWLIDHVVRTLEVFRLEAGRWSEAGVYMDEARVRAEPFEAVELEFGVLWEGVEPAEP
jgi:Uma2 family endonuclease